MKGEIRNEISLHLSSVKCHQKHKKDDSNEHQTQKENDAFYHPSDRPEGEKQGKDSETQP